MLSRYRSYRFRRHHLREYFGHVEAKIRQRRKRQGCTYADRNGCLSPCTPLRWYDWHHMHALVCQAPGRTCVRSQRMAIDTKHARAAATREHNNRQVGRTRHEKQKAPTIRARSEHQDVRAAIVKRCLKRNLLVQLAVHQLLVHIRQLDLRRAGTHTKNSERLEHQPSSKPSTAQHTPAEQTKTKRNTLGRCVVPTKYTCQLHSSNGGAASAGILLESRGKLDYSIMYFTNGSPF